EARRTLEDLYEATDGGHAWKQEWMQWRYIQHLNASLGELWLALDEPKKAFAFADACLAIAHETESRRYLARGHRVRGEALFAMGQHEEAARDLEAALQMAQQLGTPPQIVWSLAALARLREAQGRCEDAAASYQQALACIEQVAAGLSDPG